MSADSEILKQAALRLSKQAKIAARQLAPLSSAEKNRALLLMADKIGAKSAFLVEENAKDLDFAKANGVSNAVLDRIALNPKRVQAPFDPEYGEFAVHYTYNYPEMLKILD